MPELPEVETIVRRLQEVLVAKVIADISVFREKSFQGNANKLIGLSILAITRRAKIISIALSNGKFLLIHLKMTGQLIYVDGNTRVGGGHPTDDFVSSLPSTHTRICMNFTDGTTLFFNDMRVFGWWKLVNQHQRDAELNRFAPDVIDPIVTSEYLRQKLATRSTPIKVAIMDSSLVSGVGNIYACDGLFEARLDPRRLAKSLSADQYATLLTSLQTVIHQGISLGGATIKNYMTIDGLSGGYQHVVRVYGKEGEPCPCCRNPIVRIKQAGRSTFLCERCQK